MSLYVRDIPALQLYTALYELPQFFEFISERDARWYSDRRYAELRCPFCGGSVSAKWKDGFPRFTSHNPAKCSHFRSTSPLDFYGLTKVKAERALIESGLKYWMIIRQTFIALPDVFSLLAPLMFHQPLNQLPVF